MTWPTMRAAREPRAAATSPYVITRPGGIESTTWRTRSTNGSGSPSEFEGTDGLAVLRLAGRLEAAAQEERLRSEFARLPDDVEAGEAAVARLVGEGVHGERADPAALVVGVD